MSSDSPVREGARCANCGSALRGAFCHQCGQKDIDLDRPFWSLVGDWLGTLFAFDARVWRTLGLLLARPGFLTAEFLEGRRERYVPPLRLYFFASIAMFFALAWSGYSIVTTVKEGDAPVKVYTLDGESVAVTEQGVGRSDGEPGGATVSDPDPGSASESGPLIERLNRLQSTQAETVNSIFRQRLAQTLILLALAFAGMTWVLFWRRGGRLFHHLIFSVHVHAAAFTGILLVNLVGGLADWLLAALGVGEIVGRVLALAFFLAIPVYVFVALRRFQRLGRLSTLWRLLLLFVCYVLCLAATLMGTMLLTASSL